MKHKIILYYYEIPVHLRQKLDAKHRESFGDKIRPAEDRELRVEIETEVIDPEIVKQILIRKLGG